MTKDEQAKIRKLVVKICDVCMRINQETERAAFFEMNGHVAGVSAWIAASKKDFNSYIFSAPSEMVYYGKYSWNTKKDIIENLTDRLAALEKFLAEELAK